ncbi:enolase-phosphatase E1 [Brachyistius frenatus]|uniref:enolase-phosphatase E1 n=1 Tax=Brachyistius frenatus TaxID=100188 RepID=UPI0037E98483
MDPDSPISRVERTLWTAWYYFSGAVNRFFRPQPADIVSSEPNSFQGSAVDSEPTGYDHAEGDTRGGGANEELPLATASTLRSSWPVVAWELCTTDEESTQYKPQLSGSSESNESEDSEGTTEEQFCQTGNDDGGQLVTKGTRAKEDEQKKEIVKWYTPEQNVNDKHEQHVNTGSQNLADDAMSGDMEEGKAGDKVETVSTVTTDDHLKMDELATKIQVKEEKDKRPHEGELEAEESEVKLCTNTEEEDNMHMDDAVPVVTQEESENCEGVLQMASGQENKTDEATKQVEKQLSVDEDLSEDELIVVGRAYVVADQGETDEVEKEDKRSLDEREQGAVTEEERIDEAANNQTVDKMSEQEKSIRTEDGLEENILTECVTSSGEAVQNAKTCRHTAEVTDKEQEDVVVTEEQSKTRETDVTITDISVDERLVDNDQVEGERFFSEVDNKESCMEIVCTTSSVTVKAEGETGQEVSGELGNIPSEKSEGQVVVSGELNSSTCEETQEAVPEYNNELGLYENTTQWFLEVGDWEEVPTTQLPEKVESEERESLQNSVCIPGADYLLVRELMQEKQESTEDIKSSSVEEQTGILHLTDTGLPQETEKPIFEAVIQESEHLFDKDGGKLSEIPMKTEVRHFEKEFETHVCSGAEIKTTEELHDGTEEILVNFGKDEGLCDSQEAESAGDGCARREAEEVFGFADETLKLLEVDVQQMKKSSSLQELVHTTDSEQNGNRNPSLREDITESVFLKHSVEIEPRLLDDSPVGMKDAVMDMEGKGYVDEEEEAEDEIKNKMKMDLHLQVAGMATELTTNTLILESELSRQVDAQQITNQYPDRAFEISERETITDTEAADESKTTEPKPKDLPVMSAEETAKHETESEESYTEEPRIFVSGQNQDVIDEEILDLWIETAMSENTDGIQEGPEPGKQMDTTTDRLNEERGEISSEKKKEKQVESNSGEPGLVSDTEMSSSTVESGFLDQSLSEYGAQNSETRLLKSSSGSLQGIHDMLDSISESADMSDVSAPQPNSESQNILMEETAETVQAYLIEEGSITETGFYPNSGVSSPEERHLNQESDMSEEKTDEEVVELVETETRSQEKTEWKDSEGADVTSLTEISALLCDEKTKVEDEPVEMIVSNSSEEIQPKETSTSRSGSEASSEEEIVSTETDSQINIWTESEGTFPKLFCSEDITESLPWLNKPKSEDQNEVDARLLDFTVQRSRIAVKNPHVRPPKNPRALLHMPSADPMPSSHVPVKFPTRGPLGGLGVGIKLPGLGAGFPVLKKTQRVVREENTQETLSQEPETKAEEKSDTPKQDEVQHRPKWMPPRNPGFGNPLMSELKTKLKKTPKE